MVDAIIIAIFILAFAGIGFDVVELLPEDIQAQISNIQAFRWLTAGFASIIGLAIGLVAQTTYRRLEQRIRQTPIEVIITRAIGLVAGLLLANLLLAPIFLLPYGKV